MDNSTPQNCSNQQTTCCSKSAAVSTSKNTTSSPIHDDHKPSSYSSSASSSSDSKMPKFKTARDLKTSRGFLSCIGKHLGCPFLQQTSRQAAQQQRHPYIYNSQDDLPSSSTDSFSLSYERASHLGFHLTGSNIDLTHRAADNLAHQSSVQPKQHTHRQQHSQHASRNTLSSSAYSGSSYSPAFCSFDVDCLVDAYNGDGDDEADVCASLKMYHHQHHQSDAHVAHSCSSSEHNTDTNSSDEDDECSTHEECCEQQQKRKNKHEQLQHHQQQHHHQQHQHQQKQSTSTHRRLHLSRLSIASSVTRMLNHFASSTSMRSLSCSSTPLRCFKDAKPKEADDVVHLNGRNKNEAKKHSLPNTLSASSSGSRSSSSGNSSSGSGSGSGSGANGKKKEKKQQSILRPPVHYVYMKGMSGLYSRVPRYTVCSPYAMH
ncbi:LIM domain-containing protein A [Rhagoletis pomonella]|uniref:LIM domain-containing protein A n=1 Tax=Rhagoletis pomonella TaxID=28610 RepID=UPI00177C1356|nr:LIM domain-containing protein A [Rhagoletis pomonella]